MDEATSRLSGVQALRPRARLLRTFGDELISSEAVAIIELVKNAYDADATRVLVRFSGPLEISQGKIEIIDNGHGMSLDTIRTTWMEPATPSKRRRPRSEKRKRRMLGEKGIGRFAASRLANFLEVITRREGAEREVRVLFDWNQFDDEQKYLDEVEVLWEEVEAIEIAPGGIVQALWADEEQPAELSEPTHGTCLRMESMRIPWTENEFRVLRNGLSRLISPFFNFPKDDGFQITLDLPETFEHLSGIVKPSEILKNPFYQIRGSVDENGFYQLTLNLLGQPMPQSLTGQFLLKGGRTPQCGPFFVEIRAWDRDSASLNDLAQQYGTTVQSIRTDLDRAAGVSIYRDGFRILPYGEQYNDWLHLDYQRFLNPTFRLSNNQIVGYVLISADTNANLRDQSNREGLVAGPALENLREQVVAVLAKIEEQRYVVRHRQESNQQPTPASTQPGGLFSGFDLADVQNLIIKRHSDDAELVAAIKQKDQDLEHRIESVQEVLAQFHRLTTLGKLIDTILHDCRAPLAKVINEAFLGLRDLKRFQKADGPLMERLDQRLTMIASQGEALATLIRRLEPFGGRKRGKPGPLIVEAVVKEAFEVLSTESAEVGIQVHLPETTTQLVGDVAEIQEVIINLLSNSLYWLRQVPKEQRKIAVEVHQVNADEVEIEFSDSGPGVEPEFRDYIFDPYFSRKPGGQGLGLYSAGIVVSEYYAGKLELIESSRFPGATFRITLHRRG